MYLALAAVALASGAVGISITAIDDYGLDSVEPLIASVAWLATALFVLGLQCVGGRTHASSGDRRQRSAVVRVVRNAPGVEFYAGHIEGSRIVHLTARSFLVEALCGEAACLDGEPDIAVICEECDKLGREAGGDPGTWVAEATVRVELRVAA